jgi:hypothetical protein
MLMVRPSKLLSLSLAAALALAGMAGTASAQQLDDFNGLWKVTLDGKAAGGAATESYPNVGITIRFQGKAVHATQTNNVITSAVPTQGAAGVIADATPTDKKADVTLTAKGLDTPDPSDDTLTGTWFGHQVVFTRDISVKPPINLKLPGDRPWVRFMREVLIPATAQDRDSYHKFEKGPGGAWLKGTALGSQNYWITKGWIKDQAAFDTLIEGMDGVLNSPRRILKTKFSTLEQAAIRPDKKGDVALALSSLSMYFSTASGGAVRIHVTDNDDSLIYFITDRRAGSTTGLCVMATPLHKPLASSFGKWQNDAGNMVFADDEPYIRGVVETMTKASTASFNKVSGTGRSAYTDYLGIMAIEDLRGVMFGDDSLDWGSNMTHASWDIALIRALSHGQMRQAPKYDKTTKKLTFGKDQEPASQVIVNGKLMPGTPSYIDTLNGADNALTGGTKGGNDCQVGELDDMETRTTAWLRAEHKDVIDRLEKDLKPFAFTPGATNVFSAMTTTFYDNANFAKVTTAQANEIEAAALAMFAAIRTDSQKLEAFFLKNGITKDAKPDLTDPNSWAPRASGF